MKKQLLLTGMIALSCLNINAQCITLSCPPTVTTNTDAGSCGAVVSFSAPAMSSTCTGSQSDTFNYTGAMQTYTVPVGVTTVTIETWGAQGGANWVNNTNYGGYTKADFTVTPGEILNVFVGQKPNGITGGFNGGGNGEGAGQGGGGATDIRQGGTALINRIIVAGGAGGAGYWSGLHIVGGAGGGLTGGAGYRDTPADPGGDDGTQTSSANGTYISFNNPAVAGGFGFGGAPAGCGCEGYGGGGGWWGGAGSGNCRGGGGGSGYLLPSATNTNMLSGVRIGHGMAVISFAITSSPVMSQTAGLISGSVFPIGITTNTFNASDIFGNTATCSFTVTVSDNETPVILSVPSSISVSNDIGLCGAIVNWTAATVADNCSAILTSTQNSGDFFPIGISTVNYSAIDPSGNTSTASFTITVNDTENPVLICPSAITITADSGTCSSSVVVLGTPTATDNCSIDSTTNNAPAIFPLGTTTVTWTTVDVNGNSTSGTQLVTVTDNESPVFVCPADMTVCAGTVTFSDPTATDNCSTITVVQTSGPSSGNSLSAGSFTVGFQATDASGNTTNCFFDIFAIAAPIVNLSLSSIPSVVCIGSGTYPLTGGSPAGGTYTGGGVSGSTFDPAAAGVGIQVITYTFTDANGCTSSAAASLTVDPCLRIEEVGQTAFQFYPNPASGSLWFISKEKGLFELMDINSKLVLQQKILSTEENINLNSVTAGIYIIRYTSSKGTSTARLVIKP